MNLYEAINASDYDSAATQVSADMFVLVEPSEEHDGQYRGARYIEGEGVVSDSIHEPTTLASMESLFPSTSYEWYPVRENGEWGEYVEEALANS
jgi:hypothetical protein